MDFLGLAGAAGNPGRRSGSWYSSRTTTKPTAAQHSAMANRSGGLDPDPTGDRGGW